MPCTIIRSTLALATYSKIRQYLLDIYGIADSIKVQEMDKEKRNEIIACCLERGAGMRQLSRLTGVTYGVINIAIISLLK